LWAQAPLTPEATAGREGGRGGRGFQQNAEAKVTPVPFERILHANQEPQNWLTYSGNYNSQRYSLLDQITSTNVRDLTLKWVFQARSIEKHEVTPLVVDGVMFTVQSPNDVIALDAATGKPIWQFFIGRPRARAIRAAAI
jgi:glucose dehydrogenase